MKCLAYKVIPAYPPAKPYAGIMQFAHFPLGLLKIFGTSNNQVNHMETIPVSILGLIVSLKVDRSQFDKCMFQLCFSFIFPGLRQLEVTTSRLLSGDFHSISLRRYSDQHLAQCPTQLGVVFLKDNLSVQGCHSKSRLENQRSIVHQSVSDLQSTHT